MTFAPKPVRLVHRSAVVEPLGLAHAADLVALGADPAAWRLMPRPALGDRADVEGFVRAALVDAEARGDVPFAIVDPDIGRAVGTTRYLAVSVPDRRLEIGWTILAPAARGTAINTASKLLLLQHAFEDLGARRVEFKTDADNARSRAALSRLGAEFEGVFRQHRLRWDGTNRDTAWYAIVDGDWPRVREVLERRLRARGPAG